MYWTKWVLPTWKPVSKSYSNPTALLIFDYFLTLSDEIRFIWLKRPSIISILFLINRYASIFGYLIVLYFKFIPPRALLNSMRICSQFAVFAAFLDVINQLCIVGEQALQYKDQIHSLTYCTVTLVLRTYALYDKSRLILFIIGASGAYCLVMPIVRPITTALTLHRSLTRI